MGEEEKSAISVQKKQVFEIIPEVELIDVCSIGTGLMTLSDNQKHEAILAFKEIDEVISYFIPASGSGSRMFNSLHQFIETKEQNPESARFFKELKNLALYQKLPQTTREKLEKIDLVSLAHYFLHAEGLNLSETPKGLIAFHQVGNSVLNPFQNHSLQAAKLFPDGVKMHFTVDAKSEADILFSISGVLGGQLNKLNLSFSVQDPETHAYCFDDNQELIIVDDQPLRRPAGHGALLKNLNEIEADIVLIKNIDNIQHPSRTEVSNDVSRYLIGTLKVFQNELRKLNEDFSLLELRNLNNKYQWLSSEVVEDLTASQFIELVSRPIRVCGMVKNEGEPGGGPFWVKDDLGATKQIVEKVQIASDDSQQEIMSESSHFNPVLIALAKSDLDGNPLNLEKYSNQDKYLNVKKTYKGKSIYFRELPGLWNGGMYHWNTLYIEVPPEVFSPVKSVLDLLNPLHNEA